MRKLFIMSIMLFYLFAVGSTAFAQSASLTATVRANPLEVEVSAPGSVAVGEWFRIEAAVTNHGDQRIRRNRASINPSAGISIRGSNKKGVGNLRPDETKTVTWWVRVDSTGVNSVLVEVVGIIAGEEISASDTALISTTTTLALLWRRFLGIRFL